MSSKPRFDSVVFYKPNVWIPPNNKGLQLYLEQHRLDKIIIDFNFNQFEFNRTLRKLYEMTATAIAKMSDLEQEECSQSFFVYLISDPRRDIGAYLRPLLSYFHMLGYLKFKKNIYNDNKQQVVRYRVVFRNKRNEIIKVKQYSSLAQLSDDIGKKMTSLHYQLYKL